MKTEYDDFFASLEAHEKRMHDFYSRSLFRSLVVILVGILFIIGGLMFFFLPDFWVWNQ